VFRLGVALLGEKRAATSVEKEGIVNTNLFFNFRKGGFKAYGEEGKRGGLNFAGGGGRLI